MKGVVRPHAKPTRRNPRVERKREGGVVGDKMSIEDFSTEGSSFVKLKLVHT